MDLVVALDVGGTKIAAALVTSDAGILDVKRQPTSQDGPRAGCRQMQDVILDLLECHGLRPKQVAAIGVGMPAVLEPETDQVVWAPNMKGWRDVDLAGYLRTELGVPVFLEYDGHTAVLGEWWAGAGKGRRSFVNLIIGTGIGGGMVLDGRLYRGTLRLAGAVGWLPLCAGGNENEPGWVPDHWENVAAGPGLAAMAMRLAGQYPASMLHELGAMPSWNAEQIFRAAVQGDPLALLVSDRFVSWCGMGIATVVSLLNPELVILGGGIGSRVNHLLPAISAQVSRWAQPVAAKKVEIVCSALCDEAGLLGAARAALTRRHSGELSHCT